MDTGSIDGLRIYVAPTVALTTVGIEVGIASIAGEGIMRKMEGTVPLAFRASHGEVTFWGTHLHSFEGTRMVMVPVAAVVAFVHHDIRIPYKDEQVKEYFFFYLCLKSRYFLISAAMYSTIGNARNP
jgi:hypothetical protein